jgi:hypothetical protein
VALLVVLLTPGVGRSEVASTEPKSEPQEAENTDTGTAGMGEEALNSVAPAEKFLVSGQGITRPMPNRPLPEQKRPPCTSWGAIEIKGGCWRLQMKGADTAPCYPDLYEHEGRCYGPVFNTAERVPTSEEPK